MIPSNQEPHSSSTSNEQRPATASLAGLMAPVQCALKTVDGTAELRVRGLSMDRTLLLLAESGDEYTNLVLGFRTEVTLPPIESSNTGNFDIHEAGELLDRIAWIVLLDGAVEDGDAQAMQRAWERGGCLLDAEVRATTSVVSDIGGTLVFRSTDEELLLLVVGELLCNYVAEQRSQSITALTRPEPGLVHALLAISGTLSIRPIETELYSTWVDIGINTCPHRSIGPADTSIIYDTVGNSWHGDL